MNQNYSLDLKRYIDRKEVPLFQKYFRKMQDAGNPVLKIFYKIAFRVFVRMRHCEISEITQIEPGLYLGHAYCITINSAVKIGRNVNIHKGVTIGVENRGLRKGTPVIGNCVWIGVNSTIVGNVHIGDDVLIAPNTYVNRDIPAHSVVLGNPCIIKHKENATEHYIDRKI